MGWPQQRRLGLEVVMGSSVVKVDGGHRLDGDNLVTGLMNRFLEHLRIRAFSPVRFTPDSRVGVLTILLPVTSVYPGTPVQVTGNQ